MDFTLVLIVFFSGAAWLLVGFAALFLVDRYYPVAVERVIDGSPIRSLLLIWIWPLTLIAVALAEWQQRRHLRRRYG